MSNANKYNFFKNSLSLSSFEYDIFIHEYYHHLQNVTTLLGAERLNLFVQLLGHSASLGSVTNTIISPFKSWYNIEKNKEIKDVLNQILSHISMWDYIEKYDLELDTFQKEQLGQIVIGQNHMFGNCNPCYVQKMGKKVIGFKIGGNVISESSAYSIQRFFKNKPPDANEFFPKLNSYPYTLIPYLLEHEIDSTADIFLSTFLFCELALSVGTPASGFLEIWAELKSKKYSITDVIKEFNEMKIKLNDSILYTSDTAMSLVDDTIKSSENLSQPVREVIMWQCNQLLSGLTHRKENCFFLGNKIFDPNRKGLEYLIKEFPPLSIDVNNEKLINNNNVHNLLSIYIDCIIYLISNPKGFLLKFQNSLEIDKKEESKGIYKVKIKLDNDKTTDDIGYVLNSLNLSAFNLKII